MVYFSTFECLYGCFILKLWSKMARNFVHADEINTIFWHVIFCNWQCSLQFECSLVCSSETIYVFSLLTMKTCFFVVKPKTKRIYVRVSQEECARLRESVPYVKVYRYNPKHLYPKLNGYGDNGQRIVGASCGFNYCNLHSWCVARERWWPWEWNAVLIVPAWLLVACTGFGSAM